MTYDELKKRLHIAEEMAKSWERVADEWKTLAMDYKRTYDSAVTLFEKK